MQPLRTLPCPSPSPHTESQASTVPRLISGYDISAHKPLFSPEFPGRWVNHRTRCKGWFRERGWQELSKTSQKSKETRQGNTPPAFPPSHILHHCTVPLCCNILPLASGPSGPQRDSTWLSANSKLNVTVVIIKCYRVKNQKFVGLICEMTGMFQEE